MDFLLSRFAGLIHFLLQAVQRLLSSTARGPRGMKVRGIVSRSAAPMLIAPDQRPYRSRSKRQMQWICMADFNTLLIASSDLVVIDLRANSEQEPLPLPAAQVLPVQPHDLQEVLQWLPANRSAVFYGASGLSIAMIETSACMRGSAPLYLLQPESACAEAA